MAGMKRLLMKFEENQMSDTNRRYALSLTPANILFSDITETKCNLVGFCYLASIQNVIGRTNVGALSKCQLLTFTVSQLCECIYLLGYTLGVANTLAEDIVEGSEYWKLQKKVLKLIQDLRNEVQSREG